MKCIKVSSAAVKHIPVVTSPKDRATVDTMRNHIYDTLEMVFPEKPDLVVLPEFCDIPDNYDNKQKRIYCRTKGDTILYEIKASAKENNCYIAYNTIRPDGDKHYNSTMLINRRGEVEFVYDKYFLYLPEMDDGLTAPGKIAGIYKCELGKLAFGTCYDLNIDSLWNKYNSEKPDLIIFCSMFHGGFMQQMRAFQARAHFISAISSPAPSVLLSPVGKVAAQDSNYLNYFTADLNTDCAVIHLDFNIDKFGAIKKKYGPKVRIDDPGFLGSAVLYSESQDFTAADIVSEFGLETLDDYLVRAEKKADEFR